MSYQNSLGVDPRVLIAKYVPVVGLCMLSNTDQSCCNINRSLDSFPIRGTTDPDVIKTR